METKVFRNYQEEKLGHQFWGGWYFLDIETPGKLPAVKVVNNAQADKVYHNDVEDGSWYGSRSKLFPLRIIFFPGPWFFFDLVLFKKGVLKHVYYKVSSIEYWDVHQADKTHLEHQKLAFGQKQFLR